LLSPPCFASITQFKKKPSENYAREKIGTPIRPVKKKLEFLPPSVCGLPPREKKKKNGSKPKKKAFFSAHPEGGRVH
jgi:hypothetical protein